MPWVLLALILVVHPCYSDGVATFNVVRIDGQNYINLADITRFYKFDKGYTQSGLNLHLQSKYKNLRLRINSREAYYNNVHLWLHYPPIEKQNSILISESDIRKVLDPILRPWVMPRKKVKTIMIDPGHGGEDGGTVGYRGTLEKKYALDLATRVEVLLKNEGFNTLLTRRRDIYVSLEDRSEMANSSEADIFVSIHFNSSKPNNKPQGVETYCLTPAGLHSTGSIRRRLGLGRFDDEPGNQFDPYNMLLAYYVQQKLVSLIPEVEDRGIKFQRYFVIKATERPSILIENGFLSNPTEEKKILSAAYRNKLARAIVDGIKRYAAQMNGGKKN